MRRRRPRATALAAALSAAALLAAGCGGDGGGDPHTIELVVAQYTEGTQPYWTDLIEDFEADHPGTSVRLRVIGWDNLQNQVNTMVQTRQFPDILNTNLFADYAEAGLLHPARDVLPEDKFTDFVPVLAENASLEGEQYALPFVATVNAMYYNRTIFAEAGISEPPRTWDEFLEAVERVKALPGDHVPYALALGFDGGDYEFGTWARSNGGGWKQDGEWAVNSDRNVATLEFLRDLVVEHGATQPNPGQTNRPDGTWPLFAQGRAAMVYAPLGGSAFLDPVHEAGVDYGTTTHPTNGGAEPSTHGIQDYLVAFDNPGNQELVTEFLDYFYEPENYTAYLEVEGLLPTTESGVEEFRDDPDVGQYVEQIHEARLDPTYEPVWAQLRGTMAGELGTAVAPDGDPRAVLDRGQDIATSGP